LRNWDSKCGEWICGGDESDEEKELHGKIEVYGAGVKGGKEKKS